MMTDETKVPGLAVGACMQTVKTQNQKNKNISQTGQEHVTDWTQQKKERKKKQQLNKEFQKEKKRKTPS